MRDGVLILGSKYGDPTSANGICLKNIADELVHRGYQVQVITDAPKDESYDLNGVTVHAIKQSHFMFMLEKKRITKLSKAWFSIYSKIRRVLLVPLYPNVAPIRAWRVENLADKLIQENDIRMVMGSFVPYEAIKTTNMMKKKYADRITAINYHLDVILDPNSRNSLIRGFMNKRLSALVEEEYRYLDGLILPKNLQEKMKGRGKTSFIDFPVYVPANNGYISDVVFPDDKINIVYIGTITAYNRSPEYMIDFFQRVNSASGYRYVLHIWGFVEEAILETLQNIPWVIYHGIVNNAYVSDLQRKADYLLNISNQNTINSIPSKIFQMFAACRPIINFIKNREDCSIPYFNRYGYVIAVYEDQPIDDQIKAFEKYEQNRKEIEICYPESLIRESTPTHFVDMLEREYMCDGKDPD